MDDQILNYLAVEGFANDAASIIASINIALEMADDLLYSFSNETNKGLYFGQALDGIQIYLTTMKEDISELLGYMELIMSYILYVEETVKSEDEAICNTFETLNNVEVEV